MGGLSVVEMGAVGGDYGWFFLSGCFGERADDAEAAAVKRASAKDVSGRLHRRLLRRFVVSLLL